MNQVSARPLRHIFLFLALIPLPGDAQELRLGAVRSWPGNNRLGSPLGLVVSVGGRSESRFGFRLAYERSSDRFNTFGSTCVGLIPPEPIPDCAAETQREAVDLQAVTLSAPVTALTRERLEVAVVPTFRWSWFESRRTGLASGRRLEADEGMWGLSLGGEVSYQALPSFPAHLFLGAHAGFLGKFEFYDVVDGYFPFDTGFPLIQVEVGVAFRR